MTRINLHRTSLFGGVELVRLGCCTTSWRVVNRAYTVGDLVSGEITFRCGRESWRQRSGEICLFEPDALVVAEPHNARWQGLILPPKVFEAAALRRGLSRVSSTHLVLGRDTHLLRLTRAAMAAIANDNEQDDPTIEWLLQAMAARIVDAHADGSHRRSLSVEERIVARAISHMQAHYMEKLPLEDLARAAGAVSRFQLARAFDVVLLMPPHEYLVVLRCSLALSLISNGSSCADAAQQTGFTDQSHLTRHFRNICGGLTPGAWLKVARGLDPSEEVPAFWPRFKLNGKPSSSSSPTSQRTIK